MDDNELAQIRARRLAELQGQHGQGNLERQHKEQEAKAREMEAKNSILSQILAQDARARLNSIALVKPEKAAMIENMLINMAQSGRVSSKIGESQLIKLLEEINEKTQKKTTVKFDRRRYDLDDSD